MNLDKSRSNLQDIFLNEVRKTKTPVTLYLMSGIKLQGIITWFDVFSILLRRDNQVQLVYKHGISTVMPAEPILLYDENEDELKEEAFPLE
jgi:host factor-I protein